MYGHVRGEGHLVHGPVLPGGGLQEGAATSQKIPHTSVTPEGVGGYNIKFHYVRLCYIMLYYIISVGGGPLVHSPALPGGRGGLQEGVATSQKITHTPVTPEGVGG